MQSVDCHKDGADRQLQWVHCQKEGADRQMQSVHCQGRKCDVCCSQSGVGEQSSRWLR